MTLFHKSFIFAICVFSLGAFCTEKSANTKNPTSTQPVEIKYLPREDFDMQGFNDEVIKYADGIKKKVKSTSVKGVELLLSSRAFASWYDHPYIEEATKINKSWFKDVSTLLAQMSKSKSDMDATKDINMKERYDADKLQYDKLLKKLQATLAKPPKFSDEEYKKLLEQNKKKYSAKKNKQ